MRVFRVQSRRSRGLLRDLILIVGILTLRLSWGSFLAGLAIFLFGFALHFWSKGCLVRNWMVSKSGPYRLVRHPFYLANFIIDIGLCVMTGNPYLLAAYVPLFLATYLPVIRAEERDLLEAHGEEYAAYARQVPCLLPYKLHRLFGPLDLAWVNIVREQEIPRLFRISALPLVLVLAHIAWGLSFRDWWRSPAILACLGGILLLNVLSLVLRWDPFSELAEAEGRRGLSRFFRRPGRHRDPLSPEHS